MGFLSNKSQQRTHILHHNAFARVAYEMLVSELSTDTPSNANWAAGLSLMPILGPRVMKYVFLLGVTCHSGRAILEQFGVLFGTKNGTDPKRKDEVKPHQICPTNFDEGLSQCDCYVHWQIWR